MGKIEQRIITSILALDAASYSINEIRNHLVEAYAELTGSELDINDYEAILTEKLNEYSETL